MRSCNELSYTQGLIVSWVRYLLCFSLVCTCVFSPHKPTNPFRMWPKQARTVRTTDYTFRNYIWWVLCVLSAINRFSASRICFFLYYFFLLMRGDAPNFAKQNGNANNNNFSRIQCVKSVLKASKSSSVPTPRHTEKATLGRGKCWVSRMKENLLPNLVGWGRRYHGKG